MGSDDGTDDIMEYETEVSIHAPAWGATIIAIEGATFFFVSIHAPAWGATFHKWDIVSKILCFNPRSRMGSDIADNTDNKQWNMFQSTLPHGERQCKV